MEGRPVGEESVAFQAICDESEISLRENAEWESDDVGISCEWASVLGIYEEESVDGEEGIDEEVIWLVSDVAVVETYRGHGWVNGGRERADVLVKIDYLLS